ncbi:MAG: glutaredoxin [Chloroflexi bacterium]|nr:glutaredoxin [Chloroflexota bacterium]
MTMLQEKDRQHLIGEFENLAAPVKMVIFTQDSGCMYCPQTIEIAQEVAALSDRLTVEIYDYPISPEEVGLYKVDKTPAIVMLRGSSDGTWKDYGIRYYGIPAGYEFSSLVHDLLMVSNGDSGLSAETRQELAALDSPLHLQVFVTPTCPYCPNAVLLAHQLAMESDFITADMVEANEFPQLSMQYQVMGVPRTVINETVHLEGAAPEAMLMERVRQALAN